MGLDMYLEKEIYIGANYEFRKITGNIELFEAGEPIKINSSKVSTISEQAAYWRKANAIHNWFVKNVQGGVDDCGRYAVERCQFEDLLDLINKVLESISLVDGALVAGYTFQNGEEQPILEDGKIIEDNAVASELLPTQSGFFFGNTEYNEWYVDDLVYTKEVIESILSEKEDFNITYYYSSSW